MASVHENSHESRKFDGCQEKTLQKFDIRNWLDRLEPGKGKNFYKCPVCEGRRLGIEPKTGKYQCFSGGCSTADIREAIRPVAEFLAELKGDSTYQPKKSPKVEKKVYAPAPIPSGAALLRLPAPGTSPQPELLKHFLKDVPRTAEQITYSYGEKQKVLRFQWKDATKPKGRDKTYRQTYIDKAGKRIWKKGTDRWLPYRLSEILETLKGIPDGVAVAVLLQEGEPSVELARGIGLASLTLVGNTWNDAEIEAMITALRASGKNIVLVKLRDNDQPGVTKAAKVQEVCNRLNFPCMVIDPSKIYPDIPDAGDIREILEGIGADEFLERLNAEIAAARQPLDTPLAPLPFEQNPKYTQALRLWKKLRTYTPTVQSDSEFVQHPEPPPNSITAIKAGLGRGKTHWLAWLAAVSIIGKFLLLGHRNALLRGTCKRINAYHIRYDDGQIMLVDPNGRVASCVNSLWRFLDDCAKENTTIILDEIESLRLHILKGGKISASQRPEILRKFAHLLNTCSRIILLDGHLTDETVAWISSLAPGKSITKYQNTFKAKLPPVTIYRGGAPLKPWQVEAFKNMVLKAERPAVFVDSKDDAGAFFKQLEEKHGEGKGLLLTADTVGEDWQGEFMDSPKASIQKHQWAFIVASPLVQDGVDISTDEPYFSDVFGMFGGVVSVNSVVQMVRRVRNPIGGIKMLVAERGYSAPDSDEVDEMNLLKTLVTRTTNELLEFEDGDFREIAERQLDALKSDPHLLTYLKLKTFSNLERPHLYDFVCELLHESGHQVTELDIEKVESTEHKAAKEEGKQERAEAVAAAKIIDIAEAEKIKKSHSAKREDILATERAILADRLPGIPITPELVLRVKKERNLISSLQNLWYFQNPVLAKHLRKIRWEEGKTLCFASDHKTTPLVLQAFKNINIGQFLGEGNWSAESPAVLAVAKWGQGKQAKLIDKAIGETETPIQYLQRLLAVIGIKLIGKRKFKGKHEYSYLPNGGSLPADFPELFAAVSSKMFERFEEKVEKNSAKKRSAVSPRTLDSTELDPIPPLTTESLNNNVGEGGMKIEATEPHCERIEVGSRVQILDGDFRGQSGKVTATANAATGIDYYILLADATKAIVTVPYRSESPVLVNV